MDTKKLGAILMGISFFLGIITIPMIYAGELESMEFLSVIESITFIVGLFLYFTAGKANKL